MKLLSPFILPALLSFCAEILAASAQPAPPASQVVVPDAVRSQWEKADFRFTPAVEAAFLAHAKAAALKKLADEGKTLPADFVQWIDSDPVVATTVYGARQDPTGILLNLRSLEIDLGQEVVRKEYTQLALAMAVVHAQNGANADLSPRQLLVPQVGDDPRVLVNTTDPNRALDLNDHIINFLNSNTIEEDVVVGQKEEQPPLRYDEKGVAIPPPQNAKLVKVPIKEKRTRSLYAADVMASKALQEKFNAYMKEKGQNVAIDCGDRVIHWNSTAGAGAKSKNIAEAFKMFRTAYEEKGLLPKARDPFPSPAELMALLIRNDRHIFPAETQAQRKWPLYPLNAPWPVITLLAADKQPLREREERWVAFRDAGTIRTYGVYTGDIAHQGEIQAARRLKPFAYPYGSFQMMEKDGGVCGTMAGMGARTWNSLGVPASTAVQPGHCAYVRFTFDANKGIYGCIGEQYATGGDRVTFPHTPWFFGDVIKNRGLQYHQSVTWAVNYGLQSYLDSTVAHALFQQLSDADRATHGAELLQSALTLNPYNYLLVDDVLDSGTDPAALVAFWKTLKLAWASGKPGCPADSYSTSVMKDKLFAKLTDIPAPTGRKEATAILAFLQEEKCANQATLAAYKIAIDGLPALLTETEAAFKSHLASSRTNAACGTMAESLTATAEKITNKSQRSQWAMARWQEIQGKELYLHSNGGFLTDASVAALAKLAGTKPRAKAEQTQSFLDQIAERLKTEVAAQRTPEGCKKLAGLIAATAKQLKDPAQKQQWLKALSGTIAGKENYEAAGAKPNAKPLRDPSADTIEQLLKASAPPHSA